MNASEWAIGVDLGGTKIEAACVTKNGEVRNRAREKTDVSGGSGAIQKQIVKLAKKLIEEAEIDPIGLGIGIAGQIDDTSGVVKFAPNLKWEDVSVRANLKEKLNIPVAVLNDVRAATWGEWLHGAGKNVKNMICVFVGTGIGGGIVSHGNMLRGAGNMAGEIGHMIIKIDGPICHCGNKGCLEALAGSWAIARDAQLAVKKNKERSSRILSMAGNKIENIAAEHVLDAYKQGDELASSIIENVVHALAGGLTNLANALNPKLIIMGGGVTEHLSDLIPNIKKEIADNALEAAIKPLEIVPAQLHNDSGVIGAAAFTFRKQSENTK